MPVRHVVYCTSTVQPISYLPNDRFRIAAICQRVTSPSGPPCAAPESWRSITGRKELPIPYIRTTTKDSFSNHKPSCCCNTSSVASM